jgi:hormone-sensitive lipase
MIYVPLDPSKDADWDIFMSSKDAIPVRVLHHEALPQKGKEKSATKTLEDVIVHIHGGGYVALSSTATQLFTRSCANETKVPIFSIDYRLAPNHQFPQPMEDCLRVYEFILNHIDKHFNIKPKNVYVAGDSAGGTISCGLIALLMQRGIKIPNGLFMAYPSLDSRKIFYGSRKYILEEPLLWPSLIKLAYRSYFPEGHDYSDKLSSPLLLTE